MSLVARTGLGEDGVEGEAEQMLNVIDMVGDKMVDGTGEIHAEKLILSRSSRKQSRAQMVSNVG